MKNLPFTRSNDGVLLGVRVTPRASRNAFVGLDCDTNGRAVLQLRIAAPPSDGAANKAVITYLADMFGLPKSHIKIVGGLQSRFKRVALSGEPEVLAQKIEKLIS